MKLKRYCIWLIVVAFMAGCSSSGHRAPVVERATGDVAVDKQLPAEKDWRPQTYSIQKGDTLFSIAFNYGLDYHELAELNGIQDPNVIQIGQQIRLFPGAAVIARPVVTEVTRPVVTPVVTEIKPGDPAIKEQPKVVKYAYSEAAMAQIEKVQTSGQVAMALPSKPETSPKPDLKPETKPEAKPATKAVTDDADENLKWGMPAVGKLIAGFSESANRKGVDISGKLGQPVYSSAPGKVVYSGSGLRGYGKLVIIRHNNTYLSAYAHNDQIMVKEGQSVTRGQKIAEMGNSDADQVKLHFEVRRFGKPVDPAKYLPLGKS